MRYDIGDVLVGMELVADKDVARANAKYDELVADQQEHVRLQTEAPGALRVALLELGERYATAGSVQYSDREAILKELDERVFKTLPSTHVKRRLTLDLEEANRKVVAAESNRDAVVHRTDGLAAFLEALQLSGETKVSQHGIRQAGFTHHTISRYIIARQRDRQKKKED